MDALEEMMSRIKKTKLQNYGTNYTTNVDSNYCEICKNTGFEVFYDGEGRCWTKECSCGFRQKQIMNNRLAFANIPSAYKNIRLESFKTDIYNTSESQNKAMIVLKCINYWLSDFNALKTQGMGLYMYSTTKGSGKTMMATCIANELMHEKNCQVKFCTSLQILNEIKASWGNENNYSESKLLDFLSTTEILIIDDFGTEQADKHWINDRFYQIINSRYVDKKITIFTSNEKLENLAYDDRITNRIKERSFQIPFPEEGIRDILAKKTMQKMILKIKKEFSL